MSDPTQEIADLIRQGKKFEAIKRLRETTGVGLREAKEAVERLIHDEPLPDSPSQESGLLESDQVSADVLEIARAGRKIEAIKIHRERTGVGLKEAKEQVEAAMGQQGGSGCAASIALLVVLAVGAVGILVFTGLL